MRSTPEKNDELRSEENGTLGSLIINMRDDQQEQSDQDAERARYAFMKDLAMKYQENDGSRVCEPHGLELVWTFWLGWHAAVLNLDKTVVSPFILQETGERLLLTEGGPEPQRGGQPLCCQG